MVLGTCIIVATFASDTVICILGGKLLNYWNYDKPSLSFSHMAVKYRAGKKI